MWIVRLDPFENGAHRSRGSDFLPDGYAVIPDSFVVPDSFPFVDIVADDVVHYDDDGTPHKMLTVVSMKAKEIQTDTGETSHPSDVQRLRADLDYIAAMTGVEL